MNKNYLAGLLISTSIFSTSAHAEGFYLGARALAGFSETDGISASGLPSNTLSKNNSEDEVGGLGVAFGLSKDVFDYELEYLWRYRIDRGYEFGSRPNPALTGSRSFFSANTGSHSIMAHIRWKFQNQSSFTPFISVGLGGVLHDSEMELTVPASPTTLASFSGDETNIDLTWSLGGGVRYEFNQDWDVGISYRYTDLGMIDSGQFVNGGVVDADDYTSHDILLSLRFNAL